ncbi:universal protein YeaZ [Stanieria cyanosphaera PCC 7437]|uniref:Universal protein YeaZ n=1 Tax=Stanieria cyanosphaera (strain ATCC 29371 / PCC 7437) TaxID=111780 RepID=K9XYL9_STAC7|nr:tRNA (adenosine(37)-N6)-threonylcarbamoyltransferase complex dimerization subunit type 1 TsaB [Stanieria cyanosphaera]AFZ37226.1 universal protein YeaZ [Stanieria cyanosphaera PCC 7437]
MLTLDSHQYALALHTTTPQLGIAISNFAQDHRSQVWHLGHDLSSHLHQYLGEIIHPQTWQDLKFIAVAKGPGGFTGTRIGVVTARTLAQQLEIPLYGVSTLAAVVWSQKTQFEPDSLVAVQMPANRGQFFVGIYHFSQTNYQKIYLPDTVMTPEAWQETLKNLSLPYQLIETPVNLAQTVTNILQLGYLQWQQGHFNQWSEVVPFYGQNPV